MGHESLGVLVEVHRNILEVVGLLVEAAAA